MLWMAAPCKIFIHLILTYLLLTEQHLAWLSVWLVISSIGVIRCLWQLWATNYLRTKTAMYFLTFFEAVEKLPEYLHVQRSSGAKVTIIFADLWMKGDTLNYWHITQITKTYETSHSRLSLKIRRRLRFGNIKKIPVKNLSMLTSCKITLPHLWYFGKY